MTSRTDLHPDTLPDPHRRKLGRLLVVTAAGGSSLLALTSGARAQSLEKKKVTIAVGGKSALYYLPLTIAEELGYFKDEGLDVEIVDFAGGSKSLQAVVGGSADVVSGAYEHTINLQARKQYFTEFALMGRAPQISVGVSKARIASYATGSAAGAGALVRLSRQHPSMSFIRSATLNSVPGGKSSGFSNCTTATEG